MSKDWLKKFLDVRQLSKSHGRPLYNIYAFKAMTSAI
jgi:hypothetical protein